MRPHISTAIKQNQNDSDAAAKYLATKIKTSIDDVKTVMDKYRIKRLLSISVDIQDLQTKVSEHQKQLKNSDDVCIENYKNLI